MNYDKETFGRLVKQAISLGYEFKFDTTDGNYKIFREDFCIKVPAYVLLRVGYKDKIDFIMDNILKEDFKNGK